MVTHTFETFIPGKSFALGPYAVTREEIIEFAKEFDPAPFHLDEDAAANSMLGKLCASGWHISAITMRMLCDAFIVDSTCLGSPGVEECKWLHPAFPNDILSGTTTVVSSRISKSQPSMGLIELHSQVFNQEETPVLEMNNVAMMGRLKP